ncbi:MAG: type II secretion system protein GspG [Deltaproteobacteria bacterium]|nr:type II secretion system protein GspG [Deltaproteobacteria bacterium]
MREFRARLRRYLVARAGVARAARGMTLLEIMVVIAIIGIVATAVGVGVVGYLNKAKIDACRAQIRNISQALDITAADSDYPNALSSLTEGSTAPLKAKQLKDPWQQEFIYNYPSGKGGGNQYDLCSRGPDKREGTEDDICNE